MWTFYYFFAFINCNRIIIYTITQNKIGIKPVEKLKYLLSLAPWKTNTFSLYEIFISYFYNILIFKVTQNVESFAINKTKRIIRISQTNER